FGAHLEHELAVIAAAVGDGAYGVAQVAEHLAGLGRHHCRIYVGGETGHAQSVDDVRAQVVHAARKLPNLDETAVAEAVVVHDARLEEDPRHDDQDTIDAAEV